MRLQNFALSQSVTLSGLGGVWDLHNCADFAGVELLPDECALRLRWTVLPESPWGNHARWCAIRFDGVTAMWVTEAANKSGTSSGRTLHEVRLVAPKASTPSDAIKLGVRLPSGEIDAQMLLEFMDGYDIEVAASTATLEAEFGGSGGGETVATTVAKPKRGR